MLQRRHYELIAAAIADARKSANSPDQQIGISLVMNELTDRFAANNPRFNVERFQKASQG